MCWCHLALCVYSCGNWDSEKQHKKMLMLQLQILLWIIKSFVYDPGKSCLLPATMKLRQANSMACKQGKLSGPSAFMTALRINEGRVGQAGKRASAECPEMGDSPSQLDSPLESCANWLHLTRSAWLTFGRSTLLAARSVIAKIGRKGKHLPCHAHSWSQRGSGRI